MKRLHWFLLGLVFFCFGVYAIFLLATILYVKSFSAYVSLITLLIGILAICLGIWYEEKRGAEKRGRKLKAVGISFLLFFLVYQGLGAHGAYQAYYAKYIIVHKIDEPSDYVTLTEEDLSAYTVLRDAIEAANQSEEGKAILKVHPDERERISVFLSQRGSFVVRVNEEYYRVVFGGRVKG